ncbi:MAG: ABC transporter substrate-binding protein [Betaproteobacteria bacterium]
MRRSLLFALLVLLSACNGGNESAAPTLRWYVAAEGSGAFEAAARRCVQGSNGAFDVELAPLPADADQQREQLVRRLAAPDRDNDIIGMDVIWTAEFAQAGWILPWEDEAAAQASAGRLAAPLQSATYKGELWAVPFTTNAQLLWYRSDRIKAPPKTWDEMIDMAEALGPQGTIQAQAERYEGLTVFFMSLLASAGGDALSLEDEPAHRALAILKRFATSRAADRSLATSREDQARLAFETGNSSFMINYSFVWSSARRNAPQIAANMGWARWPAAMAGRRSRVTVGGLNLAVSAHSRHPQLAFQAAACIASRESQRHAALHGGLPPSIEALYDEPELKKAMPFGELLRETLRDAVQRPQAPLYNDISLAVSRTLHPLRELQPERDVPALRKRIARALRSEGLL